MAEPALIDEARDRSALGRALAETTLVQIVSTATALALTAIAPIAAHDIGVGPHWIGYQISLIYTAGVLSSAVAGALVERHGAHRVEQIALMTFAGGLLGLAIGQLGAIILASLLIGVGYGLQNPAASQILDALAPPHRRNLIFSIKQAGVPIGGVVASLCFPLMAPHLGWRLSFVIAAIVPAVLAWRFGRGVDAAAPRPHDRAGFIDGFLYEQRLIWTHSKLRAAAIIGMLYSSIQLSLSAFAVVMLVQQAHWSLLAAGAVAAAIQVFGAGGRILWGVVADRAGGGFGVLAAIGAVSALCAGALPWFGRMPAALEVALLCLMGLCVSGWNGVLMAEEARLSPPGQTGRVIGGALVYTFIGVMLGPSVFALVFSRLHDYELTFALFGAVTAVGAVLAWASSGSASVRTRAP